MAKGFEFYSLYGHLTVESAVNRKKYRSNHKQRWTASGYLGNPPENGNWAPHLHFQIMHSLLGHAKDFPGVAYPKQIGYLAGSLPRPEPALQAEGVGARETK